jgi:hypothetical protein
MGSTSSKEHALSQKVHPSVHRSLVTNSVEKNRGDHCKLAMAHHHKHNYPLENCNAHLKRMKQQQEIGQGEHFQFLMCILNGAHE